MLNKNAIDEVPESKRFRYEAECFCGWPCHVLTQEGLPNHEPEYHTEVYVRCEECGRYIYFRLPVN